MQLPPAPPRSRVVGEKDAAHKGDDRQPALSVGAEAIEIPPAITGGGTATLKSGPDIGPPRLARRIGLPWGRRRRGGRCPRRDTGRARRCGCLGDGRTPASHGRRAHRGRRRCGGSVRVKLPGGGEGHGAGVEVKVANAATLERSSQARLALCQEGRGKGARIPKSRGVGQAKHPFEGVFRACDGGRSSAVRSCAQRYTVGSSGRVRCLKIASNSAR